MRTPLTEEFVLSQYTQSSTAQRKGYAEQYCPPDAIIENLKYVHDEIVIPLLRNANLPGEIYCTSGYRCERVNTDVGGSKTSDHMRGFSLDLEYYEKDEKGKSFENNLKFCKKFLNMNIDFDQTIKEWGTDENPAWIHISRRKTGNRKEVRRIK